MCTHTHLNTHTILISLQKKWEPSWKGKCHWKWRQENQLHSLSNGTWRRLWKAHAKMGKVQIWGQKKLDCIKQPLVHFLNDVLQWQLYMNLWTIRKTIILIKKCSLNYLNYLNLHRYKSRLKEQSFGIEIN